MAPSSDDRSALDADWLGLCRRAAAGVRTMLERHPLTADRAQTTGRGAGGDIALVIDRGAEDAVFAELEGLGRPLTVVSEERGEVALRGGGPVHVVVDPIDGSLNAKRGLPLHCLSIAVAGGPTMGEVELGYVRELGGGESEWWARRGEGAVCDGAPLPAIDPAGRLEVLGLESATPRTVADAAEAIAATGADRIRIVGAIATSLCFVAAGRLDAMLSLGPCRSVDAAAGQLIVREAGGAVAFPDAGDDPDETPLDLGMRSRVAAAGRPEVLSDLLATVTARA